MSDIIGKVYPDDAVSRCMHKKRWYFTMDLLGWVYKSNINKENSMDIMGKGTRSPSKTWSYN